MEEKKKPENVVKDTKVVITRDGELLNVEQHLSIPVGEEPPYYKVYLQDLSNVLGLAPAEHMVWEVLCSNMSFTNIVVLIKPIKDMLVQATGKKYETIRAAIKSLVAKGLLVRQARAVYMVNPKYAARGKWQDIKALRLTIDYNEQGRNIEVKKITNKVIEVEEHRPKQLDLFQEPEVELDMSECVGELPFPDAGTAEDQAAFSLVMSQPLDNKPRIKRIPVTHPDAKP
jgi:hypothetical protein